jgi:UDPglucose 6-dehydrogenase
LDAGGQVDCYDPIVMAQRIKTLFPSNEIEVSESALKSLNGSDALVLVTEWSEFLHIDMNDIALSLSGNVIIDCRNVLSRTEATKSGLNFLTLSG